MKSENDNGIRLQNSKDKNVFFTSKGFDSVLTNRDSISFLQQLQKLFFEHFFLHFNEQNFLSTENAKWSR